MNILTSIFGALGSSISGQAQQAADAATEAFYVVAGELIIVIALLLAIFLVVAFRR